MTSISYPSSRIGAAALFALLLGACDPQSDDTSTSVTEPAVQPAEVVDQRQAFASGDFSSCAVCHGSRLQGNRANNAPNLTQLPDWYLRNQLISFRAGWRGAGDKDATANAMHQSAVLMSDEAIERSIGYVRGDTSGSVRLTVSFPGSGLNLADTETNLGARLYQDNCSGCHGVNGEGNEELASPPLTYINQWYFERQLAKFMSGERGAHPDDLNGQAMAAALEGLSEDQIASIIALFYSED